MTEPTRLAAPDPESPARCTRRQAGLALSLTGARVLAPWLGAGLAGAALSACGARTAEDFDRLWSQVRGVPQGASGGAGSTPGQRLLVFFDTRCGFCTQLWHNLQPAMASWQTLWVPVAILAPASRDEALALLSSPEPQAWLQAHMQRRPTAPAPVDAALGAVLDANLKAMEGLPGSSRAVPQSVGLKGEALHVVRGALPLARLQAEFA
ncbi:hypothetical protein [Comamonas serinivorans]|nr:hypothetical protein [Comamonas serinivorans]